jgi:predicted N-acyltransferase
VKIEVFDHIDAVPKERWDALLIGRSITYSRAFWEVIEQSGLNDFQCHYVLFSDDSGRACALTSFYSTTTDIAIFAPAWLRGLLGRVRRIIPNFFKLRMLECGTPVTLNSPPLVLAEGANVPEVIAALDQLLQSTARAEGQWIIVLRDFESNAGPLRPTFAGLGYRWVAGLPNTYLDIHWAKIEDYQASMQSYYRSKLLRHLRRAQEAGIRHELVEDFAGLAETLHRQWLVVHEGASEFQREVLTSAFYREFAGRLEGRSKALLFYRDEEIVGHALLLQDGELLRWLYFGRKQAANDSLYIHVGHAVIETAIRLGARRVEMGLTTYPIKQDLGARVVPIDFALRSPSRLIDLFVVPVYRLLNRTPALRDKTVFKAD